MFEEQEHTVMVPTFSEGSFFADRYRVDRLLGSGAMGRVYEATELHTSQRVALKVLHRERLGEEETVARFKREADVLASIGHPCIVEVFTFHETKDGVPYLAMELLEGHTLKNQLQSKGRYEDPVQLQPIVDGLAGALDAAHARGIVHRDLKPDNVFLLKKGGVAAKLLDFGLSSIGKADKSLTHSGMILGTPRYMSPEQIQNATSAGPKGDLYSLGVIVFESLAGQSPYPAQDYGQLLGCVLENRIQPLLQFRPDLPPQLSELIRRALQPDPSQRLASCGEFADAYGAAIGRASNRGAIDGLAKSNRQRQRRSSGQNLIVSRSETLAFDASAARAALERELRKEGAAPLPPAAPAPDASAPQPLRVPQNLGVSDVSMPVGGPKPTPSMYGNGESTDQVTDPEARAAAAHGPTLGPDGSGPQVYRPEPPASPFAPGASGAGRAPAPSPVAEIPEDQPAQGGDTMFLPSSELGAPIQPPDQSGASPGPIPPTIGPQPAYGGYAPHSPSPHAMGQPYAQPYAPQSQPGFGAVQSPVKKKRSPLLYLVFVFVLVLVVVLSAVAGLVLRAYVRGELPLP